MTAAKWHVSPLYLEHGLCANDGSIAVMDGEGFDAVAIANVLPTVEFKRGQGHKLKDDPKRDAHARLIASAPDLVEALKRAEASLVVAIRAAMADSDFDAQEMADMVNANPVIVAARAALSKAGV